MNRIFQWIRDHGVILAFSLTKLVLQLLTATHYGFHRDAYLYLAQSRHLDWGYFSTPPLLAFLTRIHTAVWGDSLLAVRLLPALVGTAGIFLVGWLIRKLNGGIRAQVIGLTAYFFSPAFLRPALLLQPVILDHLFWLLTAVVALQMVRKQKPALLLWMIPVLGLGWLNKYSIVFYGAALLVAMVVSPHRKLLWTWYLPVTILGGALVILPNLVWQYQHNWPVISHMNQLQETQLENVLLKDFLVAQVFMHLPALPVWGGGLAWLVFGKGHRRYRLFAWAFGLTLLGIILLKGKFYYTIAAYTILVVFGALAWERWSARPRRYIALSVLVVVAFAGCSILPFSLPVYSPARMVEYGQRQKAKGLEVLLKWEDGEVHDLPQDYADMVGWEELAHKVWTFYDSLPDTIRSKTWVYGEHYGCAGAIAHHRPNPGYPEVYSFNDAFMEWIPKNLDAAYLIYAGYSDRITLYFEELEKVGEVEEPWFRERGLPIWFGSHPTPKLYTDWEETWRETSGRFSRYP